MARGSGLLAVLGLLAGSAFAQGAHEPFDYPLDTNLAGASGGSGFSEPWRVTSGGPTTIVSGVQSGTIVAGLSYMDALGNVLPVSGGAWQTNSGLAFGQGQRGTVASFGAAGSSVWMSFLVRQAATTAFVNYASGTPGTGFGFGSAAMISGVGGLPGGFAASFYGSDGRSRDIGNAAGKTTLVVMRLDFAASGNDTLRAWFDPLLNQPLGSPGLVESLQNYSGSFNGATLLWGDNRSFVFDELRIGADIGWTVEAATDAYEPFDYPLGTNLHNANGGEGFDGPWTVTQNGPAQIVTGAASGTIVAGLSYPGLGTTGNAVRTSAGVIAGQMQRLTRRSLGAAGASTWLSFLVRQEGASGAPQDYAAATPGVGFGNGANAMTGGRGPSPDAFVCAFYSSVECTAGFAPGGTPADVTWVILRIDYDSNAAANDTMRAWFNPVIGQPLGAPQLSGSFRNYANLFSGLSLVWGDQRQFDFDELRMSPTPPAGIPSVVVDNTSDDPARQACTSAANDCSLRGALIRTQRDLAGEDTIAFNIPTSDAGCTAATGVCTITLSTDSIDLANLVPGIQTGPGQGFTIDGYTQPGASANTLPLGQGTNAQLKIKLVGPVGTARQVTTHTPFTIRGLVFENIQLIHQRGDGGSGGNGHPVGLRYEVYGNFFGYDADGVTGLNAPNLAGTAYIRTSNLIRGVRIGSGDPADINLFGAGAQKPDSCMIILGENRVQGNFIGPDRTGITGSGCSSGLQVSHQVSPNFGPLDIGGAAPGQGNVIGHHVRNAISVTPAERNVLVRIRGNNIGIGVDGVTPAPNLNLATSVCTSFAAINGGFSLPGSAQIGGLLPGEGNLFGPNGINRARCPVPGIEPPPYAQTVAAGEGMGVWAVQGNRYLGLQGMAVDLVANGYNQPQRLPNDADDADPLGANRGQNFPTFSAFSAAGSQVSLTYRVDSTTANSFYPLSIEFLKDDGRGNLTPIGTDVYTAAEAQTDKAISFTLPAGITLGPDDVVVATATTTPVANPGPGDNASGETSETSFYPLESFTLVSVPSTVQAGVPFTVRVRAVAAPGAPFKPNGPVLVQARVDIEECIAQLVPVVAARTSEGECQLVTTAPPGTVGVRVSYNAAVAAFALPNGGSPTSVVQPVTVTAGIAALELVDGSGQTVEVGAAFAQPLRVRAVGTGGTPIAGVPVQFTGPATGAGASFAPNPAVSDADGIASTTATAIRAGGSYSVTARVGSLTQSFSLTNEPGLDTALAIVSNLPNPSNSGQAVTVTVSLNPEAGGPAPTGSVAVSANTGEACSIVLPAASCALTFASVGPRVIQAFYPGDANYRSSKAAFAGHVVQLPPSLRIEDVTRNEGDTDTTTMVFAVSLDNALGGSVSVDYATADDSAAAPGDYATTNGTLDFSGSTTTRTISVQVVGDTAVEPDERLFVNLSNASGATIADAQGVGIILNDDQPPPPSVSIDDVTVQEPVSSGLTEVLARFTVRLDRPATTPASVRVRTQNGAATAPADFDANDFVLEFAPGDQSLPVEIFVNDDTIAEGNESFSVQLSDPQGMSIGDGTGIGTIVDGGVNATITVTSIADPGDGTCTAGECTLREAIALGNTLELIRIAFNIPGAGPHTIRPLTPLPAMGRAIHTIDGYTQPGSSVGTRTGNATLDNVIAIALDGSALGEGSVGINLLHGATVRGLAIHSWRSAGVRITTRADGRPSLIAGNYIGTDASGLQARPNGVGIEVLADAPVFGATRSWAIGTSEESGGRNLISGNAGSGVRIVGGFRSNTVPLAVRSNLIGLASDGSALGNGGHGVEILTPTSGESHSMTLNSNVVGSNLGDGIHVRSLQPGVTRGGLISIGGGSIGSADGLARHNGGHAIALGGVGNSVPRVNVRVQRIDHGNVSAIRLQGDDTRALIEAKALPSLGSPIDLGPQGATPNDPGDGDGGPNELLNTPQVLSAEYNELGNRINVRYRIDTIAGRPSFARFYARSGDRLELLGTASPAYAGGDATVQFVAQAQLAPGTEIYAQTVVFQGSIVSEITATPVIVEGRQALASVAPVREGNGAVSRFTIGVDEPVTTPTMLQFKSVDGTAVAGVDYQPRTGSITLTPAAPSATVDVQIINDALVEQDETFQLEVWSATDFGIGTAQATATIVDEDRLRQDRSQYDPLDLDSLNGVEGFRIEHPRGFDASLIDLGDFDGSGAGDLALALASVGQPGSVVANGNFIYLLRDLTVPLSGIVEVPVQGSALFPRIVDSSNAAGFAPAALGLSRGAGQLPSLGLRRGNSSVVLHGRTAPLAASTSLSTLISPPLGQAINGGSTQVTNIGDFNGDGRPDFLVQQGTATSPASGAFVIYGTPGALPASLAQVTGSNGFRLFTDNSGPILGVGPVGDVTGDGLADLIVRAMNRGVVASHLVAGRAGAPLPVNREPRLPVLGGASNTILTATGGDFDGDGLRDVVLVEGGALQPARIFIVFNGGSNGAGIVSAAQRTEIRQAFPGDRAGSALAAVEGLAILDLDGNGIDDLALGLPGSDQPNTSAGRVAILYGRSSWPAAIDLAAPPPQTVKFLTSQKAARMGWRLASIADRNADGRPELAITAPGAGRSYVLYSNDGVFFASAEAQPPPIAQRSVYSSRDESPEIRLSDFVEFLPAGDVDGDGRADLLIGVPESLTSCPQGGFCIPQHGAIALLPGFVADASSGVLNINALPDGRTRWRRSEQPNVALTGHYAPAGDFNGDGRADVAFLSAGANAVGLVFGRRRIDGGLPAFLDPLNPGNNGRMVSLDLNDALRVSALGDLDGDGFDEIGVLRGTADSRRIEIIYGRNTGTAPTRSLITAPAALQPIALARTPGLGRIRSGAVPADSFEVILGDGRRAVVFGAAALPPTLDLGNLGTSGVYLSAVNRLPANTATVAGLGDIDGDGIADLGVAHSPLASDGIAQGRVEILRGRASWPSSIDVGTSDPSLVAGRIVLRGDGVGGISGLDALRDRNGDGRRELLISLGFAEGHAPGSGKAFIVHGPALTAGQQTVIEFDDEVPVSQGVTLRYGRFSGGNWAILRTLGDIDGDGKDDIVFGADANDRLDGVVRGGSAGVIRGSALPQ